MIEVKNLTKRYGNFLALNNLSFTVNKGEIFGFLGPNGAGKTTTIKIMVGLLKPTSGEVRINGIDIHRNPVVKRDIGFIPDFPYLYEKLTAKEFLKFVAGLYNVNTNGLENKIYELLSLFSIESWENELIEGFSHGMKQRLVMSSALIHNPNVLIIDEPMVGLDPRAARLAKDIFKNLAKKGVTVFLSTHSLEVVEEVSSRIAIIQDGKIIATGTLKELQEKAGDNLFKLEKLFLKLTED
ncbi:MAG: ABC transporter ATP-binding protein [Thermodesulfobacteriota bacterium]|nr:ABC transporter ATP-binding protein [Thermodesulfobacteriota bacterium]